MNRKTLAYISQGVVRSVLTLSLIFRVMSASGAQGKPKPQGTTEKSNASAQTPDAHAQAPKTAESPVPAVERSPGGPHEGIKVHGHWLIVVRNPDGSVASRQDSENSLVPGSGIFCFTTSSAVLGISEVGPSH